MCFHGNQHLLSIKHPFISLYSKYQLFRFIYPSIMNSPVFLCLDDIYCKLYKFIHMVVICLFFGFFPRWKTVCLCETCYYMSFNMSSLNTWYWYIADVLCQKHAQIQLQDLSMLNLKFIALCHFHLFHYRLCH